MKLAASWRPSVHSWRWHRRRCAPLQPHLVSRGGFTEAVCCALCRTAAYTRPRHTAGAARRAHPQRDPRQHPVGHLIASSCTSSRWQVRGLGPRGPNVQVHDCEVMALVGHATVRFHCMQVRQAGTVPAAKQVVRRLRHPLAWCRFRQPGGLLEQALRSPTGTLLSAVARRLGPAEDASAALTASPVESLPRRSTAGSRGAATVYGAPPARAPPCAPPLASPLAPASDVQQHHGGGEDGSSVTEASAAADGPGVEAATPRPPHDISFTPPAGFPCRCA